MVTLRRYLPVAGFAGGRLARHERACERTGKYSASANADSERQRGVLMSESMKSPLPAVIDDLWEQRSGLSPEDTAARAEVVAAVDEIDAGNARVAFIDQATDEVVVDERAKHAILLAFRLLPMAQSQVGDFRHHDRMPRCCSDRVAAGYRYRTPLRAGTGPINGYSRTTWYTWKSCFAQPPLRLGSFRVVHESLADRFT